MEHYKEEYAPTNLPVNESHIVFFFPSNVKISKAGGSFEKDSGIPGAILKPPNVSTDLAKSKQMAK